jgi:hypothetical protein
MAWWRVTGLFTLCVLEDLRVNLWGRHALQGMGIILCSPNILVAHMMLQQGFDPWRGLGKTQQGRLYPIDSGRHSGCTGLGYSSNQLFQEGSWSDNNDPPRKDSHLDYVAGKRACLSAPVAPDRGKIGCGPNIGWGTVTNGTYLGHLHSLEYPHICN